MTTVNRIYTLQILSNIESLPIDKIYHGSPTMKKIKIAGSSILIFPSNKARFMGREKKQVLIQFLNKNKIDFRKLKAISKTVVLRLNFMIDLYKVKNAIFEPELLMAAQISEPGLHLNIFHNGKVVLLGKRLTTDKNRIIVYFKNLLLQYKL